MKRIRLTHKQTRLWEKGSDPDAMAFRKAKRAEALALADETGQPVEIVSHDIIVLDTVVP